MWSVDRILVRFRGRTAKICWEIRCTLSEKKRQVRNDARSCFLHRQLKLQVWQRKELGFECINVVVYVKNPEFNVR